MSINLQFSSVKTVNSSKTTVLSTASSASASYEAVMSPAQ